jgi:hypothetical protein
LEGPKVMLPGDTAMTVGGGGEHASAQPARVGPPLENAIVWKHTSRGALEPVELALGITDHAYTEVVHVIKGDLRIGDDVVTGSVVSGAARR